MADICEHDRPRSPRDLHLPERDSVSTPNLRDLTPHCTSRTFANEIDEGEGRVQALTPASRGSSTPTAADVPDRKSTASLWKGAASPPSTDPLSCQEKQERLYESRSCVQKSCANSIHSSFFTF